MVCSLLLTPHIAPAKKRSPVILLTVYCAEFRALFGEQILVAVHESGRRFPLNPRCSCVLGYHPLCLRFEAPTRNEPYGPLSLEWCSVRLVARRGCCVRAANAKPLENLRPRRARLSFAPSAYLHLWEPTNQSRLSQGSQSTRPLGRRPQQTAPVAVAGCARMRFLAGRLPSPLRRVVQRRRRNEWVDCPVDKPTVLVGVEIE